MRIIYISKYATNEFQGRSSRQFNFSKSFSDKGVQTFLISSNSNGRNYLEGIDSVKEFVFDDLKHFVLPGIRANKGFNLRRIISWLEFEVRLLKFLSKQKLDSEDRIIVSSLSLLTIVTGVIVKKRWKCRLIVEIRDIWPQTIIEFRGLSKFHPIILLLSWIEKLGYKEADTIVGTMGNLEQHVKELMPEAVSKVEYVPMPFVGSISRNDSSFKEHEDKVGRNFVVGYSGSIGEANCVDQILNSARLLRDRNIDFKILGAGPLKIKLAEQFSDLENVFFLPKVAPNEVKEVIEKFDVLVCPIKNYQVYNFGVSPNKWIDYMEAGKPILVPFNGFKNIINQANCGEFIEPDSAKVLADKILEYSLKNRLELKRIGLNGRDYLYKELNIDKLSSKYLKIIN